MLKIWLDPNRLVKVSVPLNVDGQPVLTSDEDWVIRHDPLFRLFRWDDLKVISLEPTLESGLLSDSTHLNGIPGSIEVTRPPMNLKVKDMLSYDDRHYGSFVDSIQDFGEIFGDGQFSDPPRRMYSQHYVRHRTFKGQASSNLTELSDGLISVTFYDREFQLPGYTQPVFHARKTNGLIDYGYQLSGASTVVDFLPVFEFLSEMEEFHGTWVHDEYGEIEFTISEFSFTNVGRLIFSYKSEYTFELSGTVHHHSYDAFYVGEQPVIISESGSPVTLYELGTSSRRFGVRNHVSNFGADNVDQVSDGNRIAFFTGVPVEDVVIPVSIRTVTKRIQAAALPLWEAVDLNLFQITALSRDSATTALNRLAGQAFEPTFGRIRVIKSLNNATDSLIVSTGNAALGDAQRQTLKKILGLGGGAGLVKYRTLFSDCLQLINSLSVLGELRYLPSKMYTANATYDYTVDLCNRECKIRVRSKAYLVLSPFRLLQILVGKQTITILNDILALYYTSMPLGELLLTLLQLRKVSDIAGNRMFYDLPMFFVHTYEVSFALSEAEMDYTGISSVNGDPPRVVYYFRDISRHLPVMRFSSLAPLYNTADVGNVIWTLLQQLVGVLSPGN